MVLIDDKMQNYAVMNGGPYFSIIFHINSAKYRTKISDYSIVESSDGTLKETGPAYRFLGS